MLRHHKFVMADSIARANNILFISNNMVGMSNIGKNVNIKVDKDNHVKVVEFKEKS